MVPDKVEKMISESVCRLFLKKNFLRKQNEKILLLGLLDQMKQSRKMKLLGVSYKYW